MDPGADPARYVTGWQLMMLLRVTQHRIEVAMDQSLEMFGMSYAQYPVLEYVLAHRQPHISAVSRELEVTRQAVARSVRKLEQGGRLETVREGRCTYLRPTPQTQRWLPRLRRAGEVGTQIDAVIPWADRRTIVALLGTLRRPTRPPTRPTWWLETR